MEFDADCIELEVPETITGWKLACLASPTVSFNSSHMILLYIMHSAYMKSVASKLECIPVFTDVVLHLQ